ncbi:hypothetical protein, partial [Mycoplasma marinum]
MNKILRLKIDTKYLRKTGGGSDKYEEPKNLLGHYELLNSLKNIDAYQGIRAFSLLNKKTKSIVEGDVPLIPAPRKRFVEDMKFVFGQNKLNYSTTFFSANDKNLHFIYNLGYDQIEEAIRRLETLEELIKKHNTPSSNIGHFFKLLVGKHKEELRQDIGIISKERKISNFTSTKITKYLSNQSSQFLSFKPLTKKIVLENESAELTFSSIDIAEIAAQKLSTLKINIIQNKGDDKLIINGTISEESNLNLNGVISYNKDSSLLREKQNKNDSNEEMNFTNNDSIETVVGVIDGGISDGIVKDSLYKYEDNITLGIGDKISRGTHAEEVTSLILFADELSDKTN